MKVKKANKEDSEVIIDFQLKMAYETEKLKLNKAIVSKGVLAVFSNPDKGFYLIVKSNDKTIASVMLTPEWSDWRNSTFLWIQSLYVLPEFRKKGVFKRIYTYVQSLVNDSDDLTGIKLYVDQNNKIAQQAYANVGMLKSHYQLFEWNKFDY
ncbi:MAG: GNAT family N-acetyltransferase [Bacteroidales bacterium]|nr:GNAT family N-acetyltransferase [Bacteroidales bacterium]MCF8405421.1 GNAT family N-acetyltransferase [Bacteroidales bacterium]